MDQGQAQFSSSNQSFTWKGQAILLKIVGISAMIFYLLPLVVVTIADGGNGLEGMLKDVYLENITMLFGSMVILVGACLLWGIRVGKTIRNPQKDSFIEGYKSMAGVIVTVGIACVWVSQISIGEWWKPEGLIGGHIAVLMVGTFISAPLNILLTSAIKRERKKVLDGQEF